jgi:hypothetical protein
MKALRFAIGGTGLAMMAFAVVSAVAGSSFKAGRHLLLLVGVLLVHDGIVLPVFVAIGALVHQLVPMRHRALLYSGLIATAAVTFVALPFVLGFGRTPDLPSALPRNYLGGYLLLLAIIWAVVAVRLSAKRLAHIRPRLRRRR